MQMVTTSVYERNAAAWTGGKRRAFNEGGTRSSKTFSILQMLILIARYAKAPFLISVVSESTPHLKRGAIRDFFNILGESQESNPRWNKTDHVYTFGDGVIEFFPADDSSKLRGAGRKILFLNEANNVTYDSYRELDIRTELFTVLDWNPVSEFWAHENGLMEEAGAAYVHSTYLDAVPVLPPEVVANIESNKDKDPNWWNVYGLGLIGKVEGLVYPRFSQVDALPEGPVYYGLDFGYSNDPSVLVCNVILGDALYSQQLIYQTQMTNHDICVRMKELGVSRNAEIWADSAEPKSIAEIKREGFNIRPVQKGKDSVEYGHQRVRQYRQFWTKDSVDCIKEQRNFRYLKDKAGRLTEETNHIFSHGMDARRYATIGKFQPKTTFMVGVAA